MINETLEADRDYRKDKYEAYERGYAKGKADAEPHWIPVDLENNEPPLEEWVLVSSDGYVMQDCIVKRGGKKIWYHGGNIQSDDRYMPLPEPYKGATDGRD